MLRNPSKQENKILSGNGHEDTFLCFPCLSVSLCLCLCMCLCPSLCVSVSVSVCFLSCVSLLLFFSLSLSLAVLFLCLLSVRTHCTTVPFFSVFATAVDTSVQGATVFPHFDPAVDGTVQIFNTDVLCRLGSLRASVSLCSTREFYPVTDKQPKIFSQPAEDAWSNQVPTQAPQQEGSQDRKFFATRVHPKEIPRFWKEGLKDGKLTRRCQNRTSCA